ncbi:uncharacterized protein VTP21DRAFT_730 [Calcarisporiella thermophila]|uniref:uncharacterized protein n=1 Tax=Calcarisporiella thermophila TaxID=911321 RepID=UPI003741F394
MTRTIATSPLVSTKKLLLIRGYFLMHSYAATTVSLRVDWQDGLWWVHFTRLSYVALLVYLSASTFLTAIHPKSNPSLDAFALRLYPYAIAMNVFVLLVYWPFFPSISRLGEKTRPQLFTTISMHLLGGLFAMVEVVLGRGRFRLRPHGIRGTLLLMAYSMSIHLGAKSGLIRENPYPPLMNYECAGGWARSAGLWLYFLLMAHGLDWAHRQRVRLLRSGNGDSR